MILHPYLASRKNSQHAIYRGGRDRRRVQKRQTHGKELPQVSEVLAQSIHVFKILLAILLTIIISGTYWPVAVLRLCQLSSFRLLIID